MKLNGLIGIVAACVMGVTITAHAQLAKIAPPLLSTTDLKNSPVTATGASSSRTLAAISASELNDAVLSAAALPANKVGVALGAASLDANGLVPSAQIPFGTTSGTVADGSILSSLYGPQVATITPPSAGSAPVGATVLQTSWVYLATCSSTQPVQLPPGAPTGAVLVIHLFIRDGGTNCLVYPPSGGTLDGGVNLPTTFTDKTDQVLVSFSPLIWTK